MDLVDSLAYSTNWSGYAVTASTSAVTKVQASWIVPTVKGTSTAYSSFWVGIDGFNSGTVEQIGTDSDISGGKAVYYAWFEFYPSPMYQISSLAVLPGDVMSASVTYSGTSRGFFGRTNSVFTVTITDGEQPNPIQQRELFQTQQDLRQNGLQRHHHHPEEYCHYQTSAPQPLAKTHKRCRNMLSPQ